MYWRLKVGRRDAEILRLEALGRFVEARVALRFEDRRREQIRRWVAFPSEEAAPNRFPMLSEDRSQQATAA